MNLDKKEKDKKEKDKKEKDELIEALINFLKECDNFE